MSVLITAYDNKMSANELMTSLKTRVMYKNPVLLNIIHWKLDANATYQYIT